MLELLLPCRVERQLPKQWCYRVKDQVTILSLTLHLAGNTHHSGSTHRGQRVLELMNPILNSGSISQKHLNYILNARKKATPI